MLTEQQITEIIERYYKERKLSQERLIREHRKMLIYFLLGLITTGSVSGLIGHLLMGQ